MSQCGIYVIENTMNGHVYVGSAVNFAARRRVHLHHLRHNKHHSLYLQRAFNKYGEEAFVFRFIEEVPKDRDLLLERETHWLHKLHAHYNASSVHATRLGAVVSEATRQKLREIAARPEEIARKRALRLGKKQSPEAIEKIKAARANQPTTQSMLDSLAIGRAMPFDLRKGMTGKKISEATRQRMREAVTEEIRQLRSAQMKTVWAERSDEERQRFIEVTHSEEATKKRSESMKTLWGDEEQHAQRSEAIKEAWQDEDLRSEQSERGKARWQSMTEEEQRQHIAPTLTEAARKNRAKASKSMWSERSEEERENVLKATRSPEALRKRSESMKAMWRRKKGLDA